jgi:hypothetical protein
MRERFIRDMTSSLNVLAMHFYDFCIFHVKLVGYLLVFVPLDELILR